jgi:ferrous iron transport protein A
MNAPSDRTPDGTPLCELSVGARARIAKINGDRSMARRLMGLGLRVGSEVSVLQHRNRGVVLASAGNRVALGAGVADKLIVDLIGPT